MFGTDTLHSTKYDISTLEIENHGLMFLELFNDLILVFLRHNY